MTLGRVTAMATVAVLLTMPLGIGAHPANAAAPSTGSGPTARADGWDSRIKPIADEVAKLRGLTFEHPVPVKFLSEAAFAKKVAVDEKLSKKDRADIEHSEGQFRAIGLLASGVDLLDAINSFQKSGVLAFYSPKTKQVTVRGTDVDISTRVTLAHELTHALQDQHFDLTSLDKAARRTHSTDALKAVIEGDAVRVQRLYEDQLSAAEQAAYEQANAAKSSAAQNEIRDKGVPESVTTFFQAPYTLGPIMLAVVESQKQARGIDELFETPPTSDASYLTPSTLIEGLNPKKVAVPKLGKGEKAIDPPNVFGAFALYLMLAGRSDAGDALAVADGWGGDAMVTFSRGDATCVRAAFTGRDQAATAAIADAVAAWAAEMPGGAASSTRKSDIVTMTACDPGDRAIDPPNSSIGALIVAELRNEVLSEVVGAGLPAATGDCIATRLVRDPVMTPIIAQAVADPSASLGAADTKVLQQKVASLAVACAKR
jgi:hypothetical protein